MDVDRGERRREEQEGGRGVCYLQQLRIELPAGL